MPLLPILAAAGVAYFVRDAFMVDDQPMSPLLAAGLVAASAWGTYKVVKL